DANAATRYANYLNGVALAHQLWLGNNVARAREVLAACPQEHRRWEWDYLDRLCRAERYTVPGPSQAVEVVPLPAADRLCRAERYTVPGPSLMMSALEFSPDGKFLVAVGKGAGDEARVYE